MAKNYSFLETGKVSAWGNKAFFKDQMGFTGMEFSLNTIPAGKGNDFVHSHKQNEEMYLVLSGNGIFYVDGEEFPVQEGSVVRVAPQAERAIAAGDEAIVYICVQATADSLTQYTMTDGVIVDTKASWMKL